MAQNSGKVKKNSPRQPALSNKNHLQVPGLSSDTIFGPKGQVKRPHIIFILSPFSVTSNLPATLCVYVYLGYLYSSH